MNRRLFWPVLLVVLGLVLAACGGDSGPRPAERKGYTVSGTVEAFGVAPVEGISIILGDKTVETDAEGRWKFSEVDGVQTVKAALAGHAACPLAIKVDGAASGLEFTIHAGNSGPGGMAGSGDEADPYVVQNVEQLQAIDEKRDAHYILCDHIDASGHHGFTPIAQKVDGGPRVSPFRGVFDGRGYEIRGLHIQQPEEDNVGLFSEIDPGAEIRNVGFVGGSVVGNIGVGALVGYNNGGSVRDSFNSSPVSGISNVGGLVGGVEGGTITNLFNYGPVTAVPTSGGAIQGGTSVGGVVGRGSGYDFSELSNSGSVKGRANVGGLVGALWNGALEASDNTGAVTGEEDVGGVVGDNSNVTIKNSSNVGAVRGETNVGGVAGRMWNGGKVAEYSSNAGDVRGKTAVGGVVGHNEDGRVESSHNSGRVIGSEGSSNVGGVVGSNDKDIALSYNTGRVSGDEAVGGVVGVNAGTLITSYNVGDVTGDNRVGGVAGEHASATIEDVYNHGEVQGKNEVGGLVGANAATLERGYNTGRVAGSSGTTDVGGIVGNDDGGSIDRTYFDEAGANDNRISGTFARSAVDLKKEATFERWDFDDTWSIHEGVDFPDLQQNSRY